MPPVTAWHFTANTLRDGRPIPAVGETLRYDGDLVLCRKGLHASRNILVALGFAPGSIVHRVECSGDMIEGRDKLVCRERTILWSVDAEQALRKFARLCALDVLYLWDAPAVVGRYLRTGSESIRRDARKAALAVARDAGRPSRLLARRAVQASTEYATWEPGPTAARDAAKFAEDALRAAAAEGNVCAKHHKRLLWLVRRAKGAE